MKTNRTFEPALDRMLVRPIVKTETKGGVLLPQISREQAKKSRSLPTQFGEVVAVGPGPRLETGEHCPMNIKVGDTVAWCCAVELAINFSEEELVVIDENALLGVVREAVQDRLATTKPAVYFPVPRETRVLCPYCARDQIVPDNSKGSGQTCVNTDCDMKFIVGEEE